MMPDKRDAELDDAVLAKMQPMRLAKRARIVAGLSQAEFARTYGIPLGTLRDWEQGRSDPDAAGMAYLTAILNDAPAVARAYGASAA
jgi:putative transcriptional regulator